jgi:malonyl CoA-acyl carrier protein transacylase
VSGRACVLFAGQSIQQEGMCRELWGHRAAREALERLSPVLGEDLEFLTTRMPSEELALTFHAQRAIHAHHLGHWLALKAAHPALELSGAIGHSVGIAAALVAAGALSIEDSGVFVAERARAFADVCAGIAEPSGLAAISAQDLDDALSEIAAFPRLSLALRNSVGKGAVGGPIADLEALAAKARDEGWPLRVQLLPVQGPYHTPAFEPCRERLRSVLDRITLRAPAVPVFMGTSGRAETDPARIRELLAAQPSACEQHLEAVRASYASGCRRYIEAAAKPQPIFWLSDQLVDGEGELIAGVETAAVTTEELESPLSWQTQ